MKAKLLGHSNITTPATLARGLMANRTIANAVNLPGTHRGRETRDQGKTEIA